MNSIPNIMGPFSVEQIALLKKYPVNTLEIPDEDYEELRKELRKLIRKLGSITTIGH